ncbi:TIR domain-containing protein, partial [Bartonella sp. AC134YNZD]
MPKIFIVYNNHTILEQTERILFKLGLEPYILKFGIVLLTPDDIGYAKSADKKDAQPSANQNVILKMGMLFPKISCRNIAILKKRDVEVPS